MDDPITYIPAERLAHLQRRFPIHWCEILDMIEAEVIIQRGGAHPKFIRLTCYRKDCLQPPEPHRPRRPRHSFRHDFASSLRECRLGV
jgi:hypothetical protein